MKKLIWNTIKRDVDNQELSFYWKVESTIKAKKMLLWWVSLAIITSFWAFGIINNWDFQAWLLSGTWEVVSSGDNLPLDQVFDFDAWWTTESWSITDEEEADNVTQTWSEIWVESTGSEIKAESNWGLTDSPGSFFNDFFATKEEKPADKPVSQVKEEVIHSSGQVEDSQPSTEEVQSNPSTELDNGQETYEYKINTNVVSSNVIDNVEDINRKNFPGKFDESGNEIEGEDWAENLHPAWLEDATNDLPNYSEWTSNWESLPVTSWVKESNWNTIEWILHKNHGRMPYYVMANDNRKVFLSLKSNIDYWIGRKIVVEIEWNMDKFKITKIDFPDLNNLIKTWPELYWIIMGLIVSLVISYKLTPKKQ